MRPAFLSTKGAIAFAILLLVLLTAPLWLTKRFLPPREQSYAAQSWFWGPYPWIRHEIFEETNDIDIAFMGSSHIMWAIDTPSVQAALDRQLEHKTTVRTIAWGGPDFDALYLIAKDLLEHRKVKMLVFYDESGGYRNALVPAWFRWGDDAAALNGLSLADKIPFYFAALVGVPRNLANLLRPTIPVDLSGTNYFTARYNTPNPVASLGSVSSRSGFHALQEEDGPFVSFKPANGIGPAAACVYSPETSNQFVFMNQPLPDWQMHFARKFAALAREHGCKMVLLSIPILADSGTSKIVEKEFWPEALHADVRLVGIPPEKFFDGLTDEQRKLLYNDPTHLNQNGQIYFTSFITRTLLGIYEENPQP